MKTVMGLILLTSFASLFLISYSASAQDAPNLEATDPLWRPSATVRASTHRIPVDRGQAANNPPTSEVTALLRNTGQKAIDAVTWKYVFYKDKQRTEILAAYTFHSRKRIEPGASVRVKESVFATSEPREWTNHQGVLISRIKYADGTEWRAVEGRK